MFLTRVVADIKGVRHGAVFLWRGAKYLAHARPLWPLLVAPVLLNALLFSFFLWGSWSLLHQALTASFPETWWGSLLMAILVVTVLGAILFVGSAIFVFLGSIISAPFYDTIAQQVTRESGGMVVEHAWWQHIWPSIKHGATKLWWYLLVQTGLIVMYIIPGAVGPIAFITLGFVATAFFLALDFLDFSFDFHGWTFQERRAWCMRNRGVVVGFGACIFIGLGIPFLNLFIPPIALVGSVLLFQELDSVEVGKPRVTSRFL